MRTPFPLLVMLVVMCTDGWAAASEAGEASRFRYESAWALSGPCCGDTGHDIAVDNDGSFFIVGNYGALDLDGDGKVDLRSEAGHDAIILKARPSGQLAWIRAPQSPAMAFSRLSVATDGTGGAFVAGGFRDSLRFRSGELIHARGDYDGMLVRYSADGDPLWAQAIGGGGSDWLVGASVDGAGHVYVAGTVQGEVDLDSDGRPEGTVAGQNGLLVASYDAAGKLRWGRIAVSRGDITLPSITATAAGTVHVAGLYAGAEVDLDGNGTVDLVAPGSVSTPFIATFDRAGVLTRVSTLRQSGSSRVVSLAHAADGELLVSGTAAASLDLDGNGKVDVIGSEARTTPFVARFDVAGNLVWVRSLQTSGRLSLLDMTASTDHIAVSGLYQGSLDLDGDGQMDAESDTDGENDGIVVILDNHGSIRQVLTITGPGADQAKSAAFSPDGRSLSVTGFLRLTADFDGDGVPEGAIRCDHRGDIFWARYLLEP